MINAIYCPIGAILRVIRRRRVRRRGGMHSGCHDVVQFGITADKDRGWRRLHANRAFSAAQMFSSISADMDW